MRFLHNFFSQIITIFRHNISILLSVVWAFIAPIQSLLFIVGFMIFVDTVTGVIRSKKLKQEITSRRLSQIVSKMLLYQGAIISLFLVEKYLLGEFVVLFTSIAYFLTKIGAVTLVFIETKSINENITQTTGVNIWEAFKAMLSRVKYIKDDITSLTNNKPEDKA